MRWCVLAGVLFAAGCGPDTKPVIESRVQSCTQWCDVLFTPCEGRPGPSFSSKEDCVKQCSTVGGTDSAWDQFWGYDSNTGKDACFEEFSAEIECFSSLTAEERCTRNEGPDEERPCRDEIAARERCRELHEEKEGGA